MLRNVLFNHSCRWETCFRQRCFRWTLALSVVIAVVARFLPVTSSFTVSSFPEERALHAFRRLYKTPCRFGGAKVPTVSSEREGCVCSCARIEASKKTHPMLVPNFCVWRQDFPKEKPLPEVHELDQTTFGKGSARSFQAWIPMTSTTSYLVQVKALLGTKVVGGSNSIRKCEVWALFYMQVRDIPQEYGTFWRNFFVHGRYLILFHT